MKESELKLGLKVKSNREFALVPKGTEGTIVSLGDTTTPDAIAVHWNRHPDDKLVDWFNKRDELQYLNVV